VGKSVGKSVGSNKKNKRSIKKPVRVRKWNKNKKTGREYNRNQLFKIDDKLLDLGFTLVVDTREQSPLWFGKQKKKGTEMDIKRWGLRFIVDTLQVGDYSIRGFEDDFIIERKSCSDLFSSCGKGHKKFKERLEKMSKCDYAALLIEGSEDYVLNYHEYTRVHPNVIRQSLAKWEVEFGIHIYYASTRTDAKRWLVDRAVKFFRMKRGLN
jgi:ERCC4-type nuclease